MNSLKHLITGLILTIPLKYALNLSTSQIGIFIAWSVLMDIDHIFLFIFKYKTLSYKKMLEIRRDLTGKMQAELYIFHSPEINIILLILSFFNQLTLVIFLSNIVHISLDIIEHYRYHKNFKWVKRWSIVHSIIKYEKKPL
jgi:hypothetical protein